MDTNCVGGIIAATIVGSSAIVYALNSRTKYYCKHREGEAESAFISENALNDIDEEQGKEAELVLQPLDR